MHSKSTSCKALCILRQFQICLEAFKKSLTSFPICVAVERNIFFVIIGCVMFSFCSCSVTFLVACDSLEFSASLYIATCLSHCIFWFWLSYMRRISRILLSFVACVGIRVLLNMSSYVIFCCCVMFYLSINSEVFSGLFVVFMH